MQEAISTQSLSRLSRLGRILQPRHFFPELPIQWPPSRMRRKGGGKKERIEGGKGLQQGGKWERSKGEEGGEDESKEEG